MERGKYCKGVKCYLSSSSSSSPQKKIKKERVAVGKKKGVLKSELQRKHFIANESKRSFEKKNNNLAVRENLEKEVKKKKDEVIAEEKMQ